MSQYSQVQVPWELLNPCLADTKKRVEETLSKEAPGAKLLKVEITLYPKRGMEPPTEEYNLTLGNVVQELPPENRPQGGDQQQSFKVVKTSEAIASLSLWDLVREFWRRIWAKLLQLLHIQGTAGSTGHSTNFPPPEELPNEHPKDPVELVLFDIRSELAAQAELTGFAVGVRALVERSPACFVGTRCEWNWTKWGWYLRRYSAVTSFTGAVTSCSNSWTSTRC